MLLTEILNENTLYKLPLAMVREEKVSVSASTSTKTVDPKSPCYQEGENLKTLLRVFNDKSDKTDKNDL